MILLGAFAFIAGIVTILSPCILPVLPIVLSGAVGTGRRRPLGIVTGFIASFTFFTLFLSTIVKFTGLSADVVRTVSVLIIFFFGLSLLIPKLQQITEMLFSRLSRYSPKSNANGFSGGLLIGVSLGLIWTPCVGPILASVITLAAASTITFASILITLAYASGTAIPMLAITYGGRSLLQKVPWLLANTRKIQQAFGVVMILVAAGIFFNIDRRFQTYILQQFPQYGTGLTAIEENASVKNAIEDLKDSATYTPSVLDMAGLKTAPEFIPGGRWFNSPPLTITGLRGKVVLVDFWTYTCINCIRTLPYIESWHEKYADKGLVIIGVHTPEFAFERDAGNVADAIADFSLKYPIVQDNEYATWNAYENRYWPAKYLIDKDGKIRYTHFGEGEYDETEENIKTLLKEIGSDVGTIPVSNPDYAVEARTRESYLGTARIEYLSSPEQPIPNKEIPFTAPADVYPNSFAYSGRWTLSEEYAMPAKNAELIFRFDAKDVFLVMRPKTPGATIRIRVLLDGKPPSVLSGADVKNGVVTVDSDRLYKLIKLDKGGEHILKLQFIDGNVDLYAFTFG